MFGQKTQRIFELETALTNANGEAVRLQQQLTEVLNFFNGYGGEQAWRDGHAAQDAATQKSTAEADLRTVRTSIEEAKAEREYLREHEYEYDLLNELRAETERLQQEISQQAELLSGIEAGVDGTRPHPAQDSVALKADLAETRQLIKKMVTAKKSIRSYVSVDGNMSPAQRRRMAENITKLALRAFNAEVDTVIQSATVANFESSTDKVLRIAAQIEKLGDAAGITFYKTYVKARLKELQLAVDHLAAKKLDQELAREHKAALREQAKVERELQAERDRLEKEKQHYLNVLKTVESIGDEAEVLKLKEQIASIEKGIADVDYRQANIRAGYVYVISNLGAFGPDVVKIGMTRRLEPMDRIKELSSASVPFNFDVHALFFSEDAVTVEAELHKRFANVRVNKINARREFFYTTPTQVRDTLAEIQGNLLEFVEEPEAEQYRLSISDPSLSSAR